MKGFYSLHQVQGMDYALSEATEADILGLNVAILFNLYEVT